VVWTKGQKNSLQSNNKQNVLAYHLEDLRVPQVGDHWSRPCYHMQDCRYYLRPRRPHASRMFETLDLHLWWNLDATFTICLWGQYLGFTDMSVSAETANFTSLSRCWENSVIFPTHPDNLHKKAQQIKSTQLPYSNASRCIFINKQTKWTWSTRQPSQLKQKHHREVLQCVELIYLDQCFPTFFIPVPFRGFMLCSRTTYISY